MNETRMQRRVLGATSWRWVTTILISAVVVSLALSLGDVWFARAAALVAAMGGVAASLIGYRQAKAERLSHGVESAQAMRTAGDKLHSERLQHIRLLQVLQTRNGDLRRQLTISRGENAELAQLVASLRGDNVALRLEVSRLTEAHSAEILDLPRRGRSVESEAEIVLWAEGNMPTVVDLKAVTAPFEADSEQRHA